MSHMIDCPCGYGKNVKGKNCPICGTDLTPLHRLRELPKECLKRGAQLANDGLLDKAIETFTAAAYLEPDAPDAYIALANIYLQKGSHVDALSYIKRALEMNPENEDAISCMKKINELKKIKTKEGWSKKQFAFAGYGIIFIAGMLVLISLQSVISKYSDNQPPLSQPMESLGQKEAAMTYIVQQGDTLSKIAEKKYGNARLWQEIYETNKEKIKNPDNLFVGEELKLRKILILPR